MNSLTVLTAPEFWRKALASEFGLYIRVPPEHLRACSTMLYDAKKEMSEDLSNIALATPKGGNLIYLVKRGEKLDA